MEAREKGKRRERGERAGRCDGCWARRAQYAWRALEDCASNPLGRRRALGPGLPRHLARLTGGRHASQMPCVMRASQESKHMRTMQRDSMHAARRTLSRSVKRPSTSARRFALKDTSLLLMASAFFGLVVCGSSARAATTASSSSGASCCSHVLVSDLFGSARILTSAESMGRAGGASAAPIGSSCARAGAGAARVLSAAGGGGGAEGDAC